MRKLLLCIYIYIWDLSTAPTAPTAPTTPIAPTVPTAPTAPPLLIFYLQQN
jgi:hypothetical protein